MLDAKTLAMMQAAQNIQNAKRSGKTGLRLLDDAENNVGNATQLDPQILSPGGPVFTTIKQSNPPRLLNMRAESKTGQSVTLVMTAARVSNQSGAAGPVTGLAEFGNGTQSTRIEFDIPFGPFVGDVSGVAQGTQPDDGGAIIQLPTGVLRAYARYDNAYITPNLAGIAFGGPGSASFPLPPGAGPFAPNNTTPPGVTPANVKAFANYFGRVHSKLYKTLYLYNGSVPTPVRFGTPILGVNTETSYPIPPFAKSVQIIRTPFTSSMILLLSDLVSLSGAGLGGYYNIGPGPSPVIPIVGNQTIVGVSSASNADTVSAVSLVFEIGF